MELDEATVDRLEALSGGSGTADLIEELERLPGETERSWELRLTRLIEKAPDRSEDLYQIVQSAELDSEGIRFAAFFAYCTYHRRQDNISRFGMLLRRHDEFEAHPMFPHLQALHQKYLDTPQSFDEAVRLAQEAVDRVGSDHPGVTHSLASAILTKLENQDRHEVSDEEFQTLIDEAERNVNLATDVSDYPKFSLTEGRLAAVQGDYDRAIKKVNEAVDKEDDDKSDYPLRVSEYRLQESKFVLEKYAEDLQDEQDELRAEQANLQQEIDNAVEKVEEASERSEKRLRGLQTQTLQFLGFFSTLLAVIISTISIATTFQATEAASLIIVLTGGMLIAFGGFSFVLPIENARKRTAPIVGIGTAVAILGFVTLYLL